jgi:hypothetical protein
LKLKGIWVHDQRFGVLIQELEEGNSALDYPLGALCTLASEAVGYLLKPKKSEPANQKFLTLSIDSYVTIESD